MAEEVAGVRDALRHALNRLSPETLTDGEDVFGPARQRVWEAISLLDRQEEVFQPAVDSEDEQERVFSLLQLPQLVREEEINTLQAIVNDPATPGEYIVQLRQALKRLRSQTDCESVEPLNSAIWPRFVEMLKKVFKSTGQKGDATSSPDNLERLVRQTVTEEVEQRVIPHIKRRSDGVDLAEEIVELLEERLGQQIRALVMGPQLDNYSGYICARFVDEEAGDPQVSDTSMSRLLVGKAYDLSVWMQPDLSRDQLGTLTYTDAILINDGQAAEEVAFQVALDSETVQFRPHRNTIVTGADEVSKPVRFRCAMPYAQGRHEVWIQIFQKNRLVHALPASFETVSLQQSD